MALFLIRRDGAALFQLRDNRPDIRCAGLWGVPGGQVKQEGDEEEQESKSQAVCREIFEETGYSVNEVHFMEEIEFREKRHGEYTVSLFWQWYDSKQVLNCYEGQAMRFIHWQEHWQYPIIKELLLPWQRLLSGLSTGKQQHSKSIINKRGDTRL